MSNLISTTPDLMNQVNLSGLDELMRELKIWDDRGDDLRWEINSMFAINDDYDLPDDMQQAIELMNDITDKFYDVMELLESRRQSLMLADGDEDAAYRSSKDQIVDCALDASIAEAGGAALNATSSVTPPPAILEVDTSTDTVERQIEYLLDQGVTPVDLVCVSLSQTLSDLDSVIVKFRRLFVHLYELGVPPKAVSDLRRALGCICGVTPSHNPDEAKIAIIRLSRAGNKAWHARSAADPQSSALCPG